MDSTNSIINAETNTVSFKYNGKEYNLDEETIMAAYNFKKSQYHRDDALIHLSDYILQYIDDDTQNIFYDICCIEEKFGLSLLDIEGLIPEMCQEFESRFDCNQPENAIWHNVISEVIKRNAKNNTDTKNNVDMKSEVDIKDEVGTESEVESQNNLQDIHNLTGNDPWTKLVKAHKRIADMLLENKKDTLHTLIDTLYAVVDRRITQKEYRDNIESYCEASAFILNDKNEICYLADVEEIKEAPEEEYACFKINRYGLSGWLFKKDSDKNIAELISEESGKRCGDVYIDDFDDDTFISLTKEFTSRGILFTIYEFDNIDETTDKLNSLPKGNYLFAIKK